MKNRKSEALARRDFLKGAGLAGAAGAATVVLSGGTAKAAVPDKPRTSDYRESEHVVKYYETTRF